MSVKQIKIRDIDPTTGNKVNLKILSSTDFRMFLKIYQRQSFFGENFTLIVQPDARINFQITEIEWKKTIEMCKFANTR